MKLVDTAGIRRALDEAESIGIQKSMEALADSDLVLVVLDATQAVSAEDEELMKQVVGRAAIVVANKSDLGLQPLGTGNRAPGGRDVAGDGGGQTEAGFLTNVRHQGLVHDSLTALDAARTAVANKIPHEMLLLDLYNALRPLDEITGATTTDDILNLIFSTFCIGK